MAKYKLSNFVSHATIFQINEQIIKRDALKDNLRGKKDWAIMPIVLVIKVWSKKFNNYIELRKHASAEVYYIFTDGDKGYCYYDFVEKKFISPRKFSGELNSWDDLFNASLDLDLDFNK